MNVIRNLQIRYLFAILLTLISLSGLLISNLPNSQPQFIKEFSYYDKRESQIYIDASIDLQETGDFPKELLFRIHDIFVSEDIIRLPDEGDLAARVCLKELAVGLNPYSRNYERSNIFVNLFNNYELNKSENKNESYCYESLDSNIEGAFWGLQFVEEFSIKLDDIIYYEYPFDDFSIFLGLMIKVDYLDELGTIVSSKEFPTTLQLSDEIRVFDIKSVDELGIDNLLHLNYYEIHLQRPSLIRYLTIALLLSLIIVPLIIPLVDSLGTAIEISIALLLGIWGIRQILIPNDIPVLSKVDVILLFQIGISCIAIIISTIINLINRDRIFSRQKYISSFRSNVYHRAGCIYTKFNSSTSMEFRDEKEALSKGKRPCKICITKGMLI